MAETTQDSSSAKVALWNDPRYRSLFFQLLLVAVVIWLFWSMVDNTITNLQKQNIASGFGFLETTAGFGIITTLIPYSETSSYGRAFVVGLLNTVLVASIGIVFATILGFIVGILAAGIAMLMQHGELLPLLWVALVFGIGQLAESTVLTPLLVGDRIGLHPVAVIFAIMAGGQLFGFLGVLLALPVAAVIAVMLRHAKQLWLESDEYREERVDIDTGDS